VNEAIDERELRDALTTPAILVVV